MPLPTSEFQRLTHVAGISDFGDAERQNARLTEIPGLLDGTIEQAWQKCLPEWKAFGRVRDRSMCVQVPRYCPSFSKNLGLCFVERFRGDYEYFIHRLNDYPVDSIEYLCTTDLIQYLLHEHALDELPETRERLFALTNPLPPVVQYECQYSRQHSGHASSVGQFLRREFALNFEEDDNGDDTTIPPEQLSGVLDFYLGVDRHRRTM